MLNSVRMERQQAYRAAVKEAKFNKEQLKFLHKATDNQVDKWLYSKDGFPDFQRCYELYSVCRRMKLKVILLNRIVNRVASRSSDFVSKYYPGEFRIKPHVKKNPQKYIFYGELLSVSEISNATEVNRNTLLGRIRSRVRSGVSVEDISGIEKPVKIGRKPK